MKKILFLGAAASQVPAIKYAQSKGLIVYTTDNIPTNPGHFLANKSFNVSTVDKENILKLASELQIDAISAYASDPSAQTAAYISEKLGLAGNRYQTIEILTNKHLFREFLKKNNYLTPSYYTSSTKDKILDKINKNKKYILKPVDSSGSKGVFIVNDKKDLEIYFESSISYSRSKEVILEEYINRKGPQIHGEGFVYDGKLLFLSMGDQYFSFINNVVPFSTLMPSYYHKNIFDSVFQLLQKFINDVNFTIGGFNFEIIRSTDDKLYLLEFGPRNGGNFMPQLVRYVYGVDLVAASIDALFPGFKIENLVDRHFNIDKYFSQIIIHAERDGHLKEYVGNFPGVKIVEQNLYKNSGDWVSHYRNSRDVVGVYILQILDRNILADYLSFLKKNKFIKLI